MSAVSQWIAHFKKMSENQLPPGTLQVVRSRGGGPSRTYYRVNPVLSPTQQVVEQATAKVKTVNRKRKRGNTKAKKTVVRRPTQAKKKLQTRKAQPKNKAKPRRATKKRAPRRVRDILS